MTDPRPSDLAMARFNVDPATGVWIERAGKTTRGTRPAYLDWPMVRGDEFGSAVAQHADLARQSKAVRR